MPNTYAKSIFLRGSRLIKKALSTIYSVRTTKPRSEENAMRMKRNNQLELDFQPSDLKVTNEYYERYERISDLLDSHAEIIGLIHKDLRKLIKSTKRNGPGRKCAVASEADQRRQAPYRHDGRGDPHSLADGFLASLGYLPGTLATRQYCPRD
jgi:hypothetical protein